MLTEVEKQLLQEPEDQYMNPGQTCYFEARLSAMRGELLADAGLKLVEAGNETRLPDEADRAAAEEERMGERRLQAHNTSRLVAVEAALKRIHSGEYGYCVDTGAEIGLQRLIANPAAERTVEQQDRLERRSRQFGRMVVVAA